MSTLPPITNPRFRFRRGALDPPGLWVDDGDRLVLRVLADLDVLFFPLAVEARVRILSPRLQVEDLRLQQVLTAGIGGRHSITAPLSAGFLQGATVAFVHNEDGTLNGPVDPGAVYAQLTLGRGQPLPAYDHTLIACGYLTQFTPVGWPGGESEEPGAGPGFPRITVPANPAAGAELSFGALAVRRYEVEAISFVFTTSAAAGNREVALRFNSASGVIGIYGGNFLQGPGLAVRYNAGPGLTMGQSSGNQINISLPVGLGFTGAVVDTRTVGLAAGDQFTGGVAAVRSWMV